jgi:hypothetical protein
MARAVSFMDDALKLIPRMHTGFAATMTSHTLKRLLLAFDWYQNRSDEIVKYLNWLVVSHNARFRVRERPARRGLVEARVAFGVPVRGRLEMRLAISHRPPSPGVAPAGASGFGDSTICQPEGACAQAGRLRSARARQPAMFCTPPPLLVSFQNDL